jgi:hypothetical protein
MDEQEVCAGTPVGCRAALGFVEKEHSRLGLLLVVRRDSAVGLAPYACTCLEATARLLTVGSSPPCR